MILNLCRQFVSPTETFILNQIHSLTQFQPVIFTNRLITNPPFQIPLFCPNRQTSLIGIRKYMLDPLSRSYFKKSLRRLPNIELVHTHYLTDAFFFQPFTKDLKFPKVVSCYGYDVSSFRNNFWGLGRLIFAPIFREYDVIVAMSPDMKADLISLGCPEDKILVHYYGTDTARFSFPDREYREEAIFHILQMGILEEKKGQHNVIHALSRLFQQLKFDRFIFHLVGDGPWKERLQDLVIRYGLTDRVIFHGFISHHSGSLLDLYRSAHIFTHPSLTTSKYDKEGIPGTLIEAMASGLPVISTMHAGIPFAVRDGIDGLLIQEQDIDGLTDCLYRLVSDTDLRRKLGESAARRASDSLDLVGGTVELENLYQTLIKNA